MFTPEQEQQLTEWGCPDNREEYYGGRVYDSPRQPHEVLAWLGGRGFIMFAPEAPHWAASCGPADGGPWTYNAQGHDPYAAVFALAQQIMEAKH